MHSASGSVTSVSVGSSELSTHRGSEGHAGIVSEAELSRTNLGILKIRPRAKQTEDEFPLYLKSFPEPSDSAASMAPVCLKEQRI